MDERIAKAHSTVCTIFSKSSQRRYFEHTLRVLAFAEAIGTTEGAELEILLPATLVHDVGMTVDSGFPSHIEKSRLLGRWILSDAGYPIPLVDKIILVACSHHPKPGEALETIEERVLFDADNMEIVGVFGALRWIGRLPDTAVELCSSIDMFLSMVAVCSQARGSLFFTPCAQTMGDPALKWTIAYFKRIKRYLQQFEGIACDVIPIPFDGSGYE